MEIIQFDLKGKMAHFRKYYANNTSMSFSIPPRTTIMGMLAAILGISKDEYYEVLSSEKNKNRRSIMLTNQEVVSQVELVKH